MRLKRDKSGAPLGALMTILLVTLACKPLVGQIEIKSADESAGVKFGIQGQFWLDENQNPTTSGYTQNLYLRRIRLLMGGQFAQDVTFFFQTDDPNLGKATPSGSKSLGSGFLVQDAFLEWAPTNAFRLDGGLMLVPFSRNTMQATTSYYTLDVSPITTVNNSATQSSGLRDMGFQARGFFLADRLLYRLGVFQGNRDSAGNNSLRTGGYVQYDFLDREKAYTFVGTALGKQRILAVDAGFDTQGSYRSRSANIATDIPVYGGDEIGGQFQYLFYNGENTFRTIPEQNDYLAEGTYYVHRAKVQPFGKFERQGFSADVNASKDYNKWGGGVNYYVHGQNLKFTAQLQRVLPQNSTTKPSNEFTLQMQVFYF